MKQTSVLALQQSQQSVIDPTPFWLVPVDQRLSRVSSHTMVSTVKRFNIQRVVLQMLWLFGMGRMNLCCVLPTMIGF